MHRTLLSISLLAATSGSTFSANIAGSGNGIMGRHSSITTTLGTPYSHEAGTNNLGSGGAWLSRLNNGVVGTPGSPGPGITGVVDTWGSPAGPGHSYVGVTGITVPAGEAVGSVSMSMALFQDGGWFGVNGATPGAGNALAPGIHLVQPAVQTTTDGGTTWATVGVTSNYLGVLNGVQIGGGGNPNPTVANVNFTLNTPLTGINGIRVIGTEGGNAGQDNNGFIGISEFTVDTVPVPEPSGLILLSLSALGAFRRSRK